MARVAVEWVVVSDGGGDEFLGNASSDKSNVIQEYEAEITATFHHFVSREAFELPARSCK